MVEFRNNINPGQCRSSGTSLESVPEQYIESTFKNIDDLSREMKDFKVEMKVFKDEMKDFKDGTKGFFERMDNNSKEMNKQWGNLVNKMGTIIEDIISTGIKPSLKMHLNSGLNFIGIRIIKSIKNPDLQGEFEMVASDEDRVFLVEVKSSPDKGKINYFKESVIPGFQQLFPEYVSKKLIPIIDG